jgi:hypothetical protein
MNRDEALAILDAHLEKYRRRSHAELAEKLGNQGCDAVVAASGVSYQIEVDIVWDGEPGSDLRVIGSVDDGGWRAFAPFSRSFIVAPNGIVR